MQWWTPAPDIPLVAYDASMFNGMYDSLKISMGAISGRGLLILGVCISVTLIFTIFGRLVLDKLRILEGVRGRDFRRNVGSSGVHRNSDSTVNDRVSNVEVSAIARSLYRFRHPRADLNEKIYQRELSHKSDIAFHKRNPKAYGEKRELYNNLAKDYYRKRGRK